MAELESDEQQHEQSQGLSHEHEAVAAAEAKLIRSQRSTIAKLSQVVKIADFMAFMMVLATLFSAYATWRTAQVTERIFAVTDRPFMGVSKVTFEQTDTATPVMSVMFRNFGQIPALDVLINVHALLDGKQLTQPNNAMSWNETGVASPTVPHYFYYYVTQDVYRAVLSGKARLQAHVTVEYKGSQRERVYCYFERIGYDFRSASFRMDGGGDKCGSDVF